MGPDNEEPTLMSTAQADGHTIAVSTREIVDVAIRSLRAHGAIYAAAQQAGEIVEELHVVDGSGLPVLRAALHRPIVAPTIRDHVVDAHGGSALLIAAELTDLLTTTGKATVVNAGEPYAVLGALRRVVAARGGSWTAHWTSDNGDLRGGCHISRHGQASRWGGVGTDCPAPATVEIRTGNAQSPESTVRLPHLAKALSAARESGLTVERQQWEPVACAAQEFLLDTATVHD